MQNIPTDISIKDLLCDLSPRLAKEVIAASGKLPELEGTELTLVIAVEGENSYSYIVKDGKDFTVKAEAIDNPMVKIALSKSDLEKMIATNNLDMLLGIQQDLNKTKFNALKSLKGSFNAELKNTDGSVYLIKTICNGSDSPNCTFKMTTEDSTKITKKEAHPVNLFMSGAMQIEGDMAFAMATQPIFT
ncbi:MAG: SCP2 sterol-binding domain-containing protein [Proteobacteria bacterium]|nr:SCP2 sterol-binding domain-containing protein [Pseudomonadota bacterium]